tara:strand:+ start:452 stop:1282 length:831 start_codon:yes stop_codon:yes gene_type:complete
MKLLNKTLISCGLLFVFSCNSNLIKSEKNDTYDDDLIEQIQNATNKIEVQYNDLPPSIISTIESLYSTQTFLSELNAVGLGYELTLSYIDTEQDLFKKIYFDVQGRKLISKRDYEKRGQKCFELVYPIVFIMPDGTTITVENDNEEGWQNLKDWYNLNPDNQGRPSFQYPINIIFEDGTTNSINNKDELIDAKKSCKEFCFELVYPVTFIMPDGTTIVVENNNEDGWEELKGWYENNPNIEFDWNIDYPVNIQLENGDILIINSFSEMENIKQNCN